VVKLIQPAPAAWRALVVLAAGLASGCASLHGGPHYQRACFNCYPAWACFGYHSTCWQPWPAECVTCPSPFLAPIISSDKAPPLEPAVVPDAELPVPLPAIDDAPPPANPPPAINPDNPRPANPSPANPSPDPSDNSWNEPSSRRRVRAEALNAEAQSVSYETSEEAYELGSLRWAPAYNR
jgi:hypothetical protein